MEVSPLKNGGVFQKIKKVSTCIATAIVPLVVQFIVKQELLLISAYLQTRRLKLSNTKTVTVAFHLNNRVANCELNVYNSGNLLPFCPVPTYLGVKLDRSLTFRQHLEALRKKLPIRVALLRRLEESGWDAGAETLRISALSLVYFTAEYCGPVWCCSTHTRLIDSILNDALRKVTECLRPTPAEDLPVLQESSQLSSAD